MDLVINQTKWHRYVSDGDNEFKIIGKKCRKVDFKDYSKE